VQRTAHFSTIKGSLKSVSKINPEQKSEEPENG